MSEADTERLEGIKRFDPEGEPSTAGLRWKRWMASFDLYADSKGLILEAGKDKHRQRRRALMLHCAGSKVQEIFFTIPDTGESNNYDRAVEVLNNHFAPKVNSSHQRYKFRQMDQKANETIAQFVTRLKVVAKDCEFVDTEQQICDQVVYKCKSDELRRKLLSKSSKDLNLQKILEYASIYESVADQLDSMNGTATANQIRSSREKRSNPKQVNKKKGECYRCGRADHFGKDPACPAKGQTCHECGGKDHFASKCKSKSKSKQPQGPPRNKDRSRGRMHYLNTEHSTNPSDGEYAFTIHNNKHEKIAVTVGGCKLNMIVDSGATSNVIDKETWEELKKSGVKCKSTKSNKVLYTYASRKPLKILGSFTCQVTAGNHSTKGELVVIGGQGDSLLGRDTATKLQVLKVGINIAAVNTKPKDEGIKEKYPHVFEGVGKLKGRQIKLHVDPNVKPVAQPLRRTPFQLRRKVEEKINELINADIIEPVDGPTPWVNPVVVVPKSNGDIRLCVDMRRANQAIIRERHPIPTVDEVIQSMNGSTIFSKLDLKWGYHQLELTPDSRGITTFATHCGLYQYKRLLFGVSSASEQYQHEIQAALAGIQGQENISDDIIVHGKDQEEHDERLELVIKRLNDCGLTLNGDKCQFNMDKLTFMGLVLSAKGVGPTAEKVKAVAEAREPQSATEVRSFLGLVNFSGRFIPDLATVSEPLRNLTKKGVEFDFGPEQRKAFEELKQRLASAETLGYFDKDAPTKVIADASPVGLGAVLIQEQSSGPRVISYASRSLTDVEKRYSQTEKEALALVWACEKFHPYIYGLQFELVTDHKPLEVIYSPKSKPCARIERWVLRLQPYTFQVKYIPGPQNIADPLSRLLKEKPGPVKQEQTEDYVRFVAVSATPKALTTREVEEASGEDEELAEIRECIHSGRWDKTKHKQYIPVSSELCTIGKLVLRGTRLVIPTKLRPQVLTLAHEGHLGIVGTKQRLRTKVWWPGIDRDAEKHCKTCYSCQLVSQPDAPEPIRSTALPTGPWRDLAMDLLGPLPSGESILVIVDYYSRYYEVEVLRSTVTSKVITCLEWIFSRHGLPETIKTDNGPQFKAEELRAYFEEQGIVHHHVTAIWPQANGEVERQNRSLLKRMQIAQAEGKDWRRELIKYLTAYRAKPHTTTGISPAELLFGRRMRTKLPELADIYADQEVRDRDSEQKAKSKAYADQRRNAKLSEIQPGDHVLMKQDKRNKLTTAFNPVPYTVVGKKGNSTMVESPEGVQYSRNTSHLKKLQTPETTNHEEDTVENTNLPTYHQDEETSTLTQENATVNTPAHAVPPERLQLERPQRTRVKPAWLKDYST